MSRYWIFVCTALLCGLSGVQADPVLSSPPLPSGAAKVTITARTNPRRIKTGGDGQVYLTISVGSQQNLKPDQQPDGKRRKRFLRHQKRRLENYRTRINSDEPYHGAMRKELLHDAYFLCNATCVCQGGTKVCGSCGLNDCVADPKSQLYQQMNPGQMKSKDINSSIKGMSEKKQSAMSLKSMMVPKGLQMGGEVIGGAFCPDLNVCLAIDTSGSMKNKEKGGKTRIAFVREAAKNVLPHLKDGNFLSIIAFSSEVETVLAPMADKWESDKQAKNRLIDRLNAIPEPWGGTNIYDALKQAYEYIKKHYNKASLNRILLFSDGKDTASGQHLDEFRKLAEKIVADKIDICTFGIGEYDETLMFSISGDPKLRNVGHYHAIKDFSKIKSVMWSCIMKMLTIRRAQLVVKLAPGVRVQFASNRLIKETPKMLFGNLGDIEMGQSKTVVAALDIPTETEGEFDIATIMLRYHDRDGNIHTTDQTARIAIRSAQENLDDLQPVESEVMLQLVRRSLAQCVELLDQNNRKSAIARLDEMVQLIEEQESGMPKNLSNSKIHDDSM